MHLEPTKIRAFTLSEMLVVLIITSLVVGLSYSVLQLVQKQMRGMEAEYETKTEMNRLQQALWLDMNQCDRAFVQTNPNSIIVSTPKEQLIYFLLADKIIRQRDTFYLEPFDIQYYLDSQNVISGEIDAILLDLKPQSRNTRFEIRNTKKEKSKPSLAKTSDIDPKHKTRNPKLFVFKTNSATTYMNN